RVTQLGKLMKHQHPLAKPIGTDFEAGAEVRERVRPARPWTLLGHSRIGRVVLAVVDDNLKEPIVALIGARATVAILDALQVAIGKAQAVAELVPFLR